MRRTRGGQLLALALALQLPASVALARAGRLAVVNTSSRGHELAAAATRQLEPHLGGWMTRPGVRRLLLGQPHPGALPTGKNGEELVRLVERVRGQSSPPSGVLVELGRLLGVDYLLLLRSDDRRLQARLFSVPLGRMGPSTFTASRGEMKQLPGFLRRETRSASGAAKTSKRRWPRWWVWAVTGGLAAITLGLAIAAGTSDSGSGELRVRVSP